MIDTGTTAVLEKKRAKEITHEGLEFFYRQYGGPLEGEKYKIV